MSSAESQEDQNNKEEEVLEEASLISHLVELRSRLMKACGAVMLCFVCLFPFSEQIKPDMIQIDCNISEKYRIL